MRNDNKIYVWQKNLARRKKDRHKKVADGTIIMDYERRKEEEKDDRYIGVERRRSEDRRQK